MKSFFIVIVRRARAYNVTKAGLRDRVYYGKHVFRPPYMEESRDVSSVSKWRTKSSISDKISRDPRFSKGKV